eukprot:scaffold44_cov339-Pavlova_lutheri.AAC.35
MCSTLDRPRERTMNGVLVPFPAPGAPLSHTTSLGARSLDPKLATTLRNTDSNSMAACGATSSCPGAAGGVAVAPTGAAANSLFQLVPGGDLSSVWFGFHPPITHGCTPFLAGSIPPHLFRHVAHMLRAARSQFPETRDGSRPLERVARDPRFGAPPAHRSCPTPRSNDAFSDVTRVPRISFPTAPKGEKVRVRREGDRVSNPDGSGFERGIDPGEEKERDPRGWTGRVVESTSVPAMDTGRAWRAEEEPRIRPMGRGSMPEASEGPTPPARAAGSVREGEVASHGGSPGGVRGRRFGTNEVAAGCTSEEERGLPRVSPFV